MLNQWRLQRWLSGSEGRESWGGGSDYVPEEDVRTRTPGNFQGDVFQLRSVHLKSSSYVTCDSGPSPSRSTYSCQWLKSRSSRSDRRRIPSAYVLLVLFGRSDPYPRRTYLSTPAGRWRPGKTDGAVVSPTVVSTGTRQRRLDDIPTALRPPTCRLSTVRTSNRPRGLRILETTLSN